MPLTKLALFPLLLVAALSSSAQAQGPSLPSALALARYRLQLSTQGFADSGAAVLTAALDKAKYVAIGEDHLTQEIPRFTAAVCDEMALHGLSALALESSPAAAAFVAGSYYAALRPAPAPL